ncbi:CPBP family intramembrane glutamic endopeptidase [Paenibacillus sp. MCAF9]|uniref:CPBP family intramembrane glutamic endopeptidase n=1 Tax=Paenibacillus sp. MCAF9 TaxID=3233046 RepID=UPI003F9955C2
MGETIKKWTANWELIQTERRAFIYLALLPLLIVLIKTNFVDNRYIDNLLFYLSLILVCVLMGYKDISKYFSKPGNSTKATLKVSFALLFVEALFGFIIVQIGAFFFQVTDPQGISNITTPLDIYLKELTLLPFIAVGEEFYKVLILLGVISCLPNFSTRTKVIIAILIASLAFGYAHGINHKITAGLPIAISAIPSFIFLLKYKSIYPLIISHFFFDLLSFTAHWDGYGQAIVYLISFSVYVYYMLKVVFRKQDKPPL